MGLISKIKADVAKSGSSKGKFTYFREGQKQRVRFLEDMDDGMEVIFHDSFEKGINVPCQETFGKSCRYCDDDSLRTRSQYLWSIWNYEANEVQIFMFPVNNCSPIPALMAMYETYGTLTDRDYVISVQGKQQNKTYSVVPMDKAKMRNEKAKPLSKKAVYEIIRKAYPAMDTDDELIPEDLPFAKKNTVKNDDEWENEEEVKSKYDGKSTKELYKLCKEREIEAEIKKPLKYYINLLEEYDKAQDDWGDVEDDFDDDWEDDE